MIISFEFYPKNIFFDQNWTLFFNMVKMNFGSKFWGLGIFPFAITAMLQS